MKTIIPVIHHLDEATSIEQAVLAFDCGADGIFLISHNGQDDKLVEPARKIKEMYSNKKIGLNLLSSFAIDTLQVVMNEGLDMAWVDSPGVTSAKVSEEAVQISELLMSVNMPELYGSVAFKYQAFDPEPGVAANAAINLHMIPTTSGEATGTAPSMKKVKTMRAVLGSEKPLAIASGMTPDNVSAFTPYCTHFLVATGISKDMYHFDESLISKFINRVRNEAS